jgi:cell division protein ZapA
MSVVNISINRREYQMACEDGQEQHLENLALELDSRVKELSVAVGTGNQTLLAIVAGLQLLDEVKQLKNSGSEERSVDTQAEIDKLAAATMNQVSDKLVELAEKLERKAI